MPRAGRRDPSRDGGAREGHPGLGRPGSGCRRNRRRSSVPRAAVSLDAEGIGEAAGGGAVGEEGRKAFGGGAGMGDMVAVRPGHGVVLGGHERNPVGHGRRCRPPGPEHVAWTRSASARRGRSHSAKSVDGTHCRWACRAKVSTGTSKAAREGDPFVGGVPGVQAGVETLGAQGGGQPQRGELGPATLQHSYDPRDRERPPAR